MKIGDYRVVSQLGKGGMGIVYRVRVPDDPRELALKLLLDGPHASESSRRRFLREGEALQRFDHPHLVGVVACGLHEGQPYLVLELLPGDDLQDRLDRRGPLAVAEAVGVARKLAEALAHAHACGVLHRDVKPENVVFDAAGEPRLTDFGLARDLDPATSQTPITVAGRALGTPLYWPSEQASGRLDLSGPWSDVYMLAGTLVAMLTGLPPHPVPTNLSEALRNAKATPPPPSTRRAEVPAALDAVCLRALAPNPRDRYPDAAAFAAALAEVEVELDAAPPPRRGRVALLAGAGLAVATGAWAAWPGGAAGPPAPSWEATAEALLAEGEYAALLREGRERLQQVPADAGALYLTGAAQRRLLLLDEAVTTLRQAQDARPDHAPTHQELARCLAAQGLRTAALSAYDAALRLDPELQSAHAERAALHLAEGHWQAAADDAQVALDRGEQSRDVRWIRLAAVNELTRVGDLAVGAEPEEGPALAEPEEGPALAELDAVLARNPEHLAALLLRAKARKDMAQERFKEDVEGAKALVLLAGEDVAHALEILPRTAGTATLLATLSLVRVESGQLEAGLALIDEALRLKPTVADFHFARANVLGRLGRLEDALSALDGVQETGSGWSLQRAMLLEESGRALEAFAEYDRALADWTEDPKNPITKSTAYAWRGSARLRRGDMAGALEDFRLALEGDDLDQETHAQLGIMLNNPGLPRQAMALALEAWDLYLERFPPTALAHQGRATALAALFRMDEAEAAIEQALELEPDNPGLRMILEQLQRQRGAR